MYYDGDGRPCAHTDAEGWPMESYEPEPGEYPDPFYLPGPYTPPRTPLEHDDQVDDLPRHRTTHRETTP